MDEPTPTIRDLYPNLTSEEQKEAESALEGYVETVLNIYERLQAEGKEGELLSHLQDWQSRNEVPTDSAVPRVP